MDNLFQPEKLNVDRQLQKETNPVSDTAETTLFQLAAGGDREAAAIAEKLGLTFEGTQTIGADRMGKEDAAAFRIVLEVRYRVMERLAETSGCGTVADLPCGYTPMAAVLARKGLNYLGLDLPAVIPEVSGILLPMIPEKHRGSVRFAAVDATNDASMREAFRDTEGTLCVITSGLLMYFSDSEADAMLQCVRKLLSQHGGCWILADAEAELQHFSILKILCGDRYDQVMRERVPLLNKKSDTVLGRNSLTVHLKSREEDERKAAAYLRSRGLRAERLIVADYLPEKDPAAFSLLTGEQKKAVRAVLRDTAFWKITVDGTARPAPDGEGVEPFGIRAERKDGVLELELSGRLDTLSAPGLLAFWEKESAGNAIRRVTVSCDRLAFISSAGFRVLLIIGRACKDGISLSGTNETVREAVRRIGLTRILKI